MQFHLSETGKVENNFLAQCGKCLMDLTEAHKKLLDPNTSESERKIIKNENADCAFGGVYEDSSLLSETK